METPLSPNYAKLFMDDFEQNLLHDYFFKRLNYHLPYGFVLLMIFSSYGLVRSFYFFHAKLQ